MERNGNNRSGPDGLWRSSSDPSKHNTTSSSPANDFVLQWGNRKRLRCMKVQSKQVDPSNPVHRTTVRTDRRVVRSTDTKQQTALATTNTTTTSHHHHNTNVNGNGLLNLRQRPPSPPHRVLRNSEASGAMRSHHHHSNGTTDRGAQDKKAAQVSNSHHNNPTIEIKNKSGASSETAAKGGGGGSSSGSGDADAAAAAMTWPPKFVIGLTNKEKEEDFLAIKGSKLPQRPKKRAKCIQRTVNLVCPGTWLCDLTLERYEVREKKVSKKRPRGLKAMGNMIDSDSE